MNRHVLSGEAQTSIQEVVARMYEEKQSAFVVCEDGFPIGIITERDAIEVLHGSLRGTSCEQFTAQSVMASPLQTLPETSRMSELIDMMKSRFFRRVPITNASNQLVGIVNLGELQSAMNQILERRGRDLERAVKERTAELQEANDRLEDLSVRDGLTGLLNRRAMSGKLTEVHALARRYGNPYSVILCDIDYFKLLNDTLGHLEGDSILRSVATTLGEAVRISDSVYRYGGEEFLVVLPETRCAGAGLVATRMRESIELLALPHAVSSTAPHVTLSFGVTDSHADASGPDETWERVIDRADTALYRAKEDGRNRVVTTDTE